MVVCESEARPGGKWRVLYRRPDGDEFGFHGEFREVVAPERFVRTFVFGAGRSHRDARAHRGAPDKTLICTKNVYATMAIRDGFVKQGMGPARARPLRAARRAHREPRVAQRHRDPDHEVNRNRLESLASGPPDAGRHDQPCVGASCLRCTPVHCGADGSDGERDKDAERGSRCTLGLARYQAGDERRVSLAAPDIGGGLRGARRDEAGRARCSGLDRRGNAQRFFDTYPQMAQHDFVIQFVSARRTES